MTVYVDEDDDEDPEQEAHRMCFLAWNTAGYVTWRAGIVFTRGPIYRFGLWLAGASGTLDAIADRYR